MIFKISAVALISIGVLVGAAQADTGELKRMSTPVDVFSGSSELFKSRVCGDLLAGLSLAGLRELGAEGKSFEDLQDDDRVSLVFHTAAASILHFEAAEGLSNEDIAASAELAKSIEAMEAKVHIKIATQCNQTVVDWLASGEIIEPAYEQALIKAYNTLPALTDASKTKELLEEIIR